VSLQVRTTSEADDQIGVIDEWWRRNRPAAPDLFLDGLAASFETIGHTPQIAASRSGIRSTETASDRQPRPSPLPQHRRGADDRPSHIQAGISPAPDPRI